MTTVGEAVAQTLRAYGTEYFFCFCGGDHELWYALEEAGIFFLAAQLRGHCVVITPCNDTEES